MTELAIDVDRDDDARILTLTTRFDAPSEEVWTVWSDPRRLERWWGPPTHPATMVVHQFEPGGAVRYYMTGPDGERYPGWWRFVAIDAPRRLEFEDGFTGADGEPDLTMPVSRVVVTLESDGSGTRMSVRNSFATAEQMAQLVAMGAIEGMRYAMGQIPAILAG